MRRSGGALAFFLAVLLAVTWSLSAEEPVPPVQASDSDPTVSAPPAIAAPAAGSIHPRPGIVRARPVSLTRGAASTVTLYEKGKSLTVKTPEGTLVKYRVEKDSSVPDDLVAGRTVLVETKVVKKRRYASRVLYAESRVVLSNVN